MPDRGKQVRSIAEQALALAEAERDSFLEHSCGTNQQLLDEVRSLIQEAESDSSFMEHPAEAPTIMSAKGAVTASTGQPDKIAHFAIRRVIGSGGMGTVYEGVQENPRRKVAVKVMRHGVTSRTAQRRFEFESQILARLHHQGIAQIYEAGTWDDGSGGVPWFAMEYIIGAKTLSEYANAKNLGTRERLKLFTLVCDAVSHGHQKGIIHRDLKPGNILVDVNGQPKVIDFGVARATDSDMAVTTLQTDVGQLLGTVQYMSPEQCEADPDILDTRSDVYSLGVVLYELLCDAPPYDLESVPVFEAARVIREKMPSRPSTINRTLRGDVETIVLKALQKDRDQRYQSAHELQRDIQRYLDNDPIEARPPSISYQLKVFARRNRALFISASAIAAILVIATIVSITMAVHATRSAEEARAAEASTLKEKERLAAVSGFMMHVLSIPSPGIDQGRNLSDREQLMEAGQDIDHWFKAAPEYGEDLHTLIGYLMVNQEMYDEAEMHLAPNLPALEERYGPEHWKVLFTRMTLARMRNGQGHGREADLLSSEVETTIRSGTGEWTPYDVKLMVDRLEIMDDLMQWQNAMALSEELLEQLETVELDKVRDGVSQHEVVLRIKGILGRNMTMSAQLAPSAQQRNEQFQRGHDLMMEVIEEGNAARTIGPRHPVTLVTNGVLTLCQWGTNLGPTEQDVDAIISELELVFGEGTPTPLEFQRIKGSILYGKKQFDKSELVLRETLAGLQNHFEPNHPKVQSLNFYLGRTLAELERYEEAEPLLRESTRVLAERLESDHVEVIMAGGLLGMSLQGQGKFAEAEPLLEDFIASVENLLGPEHPEPIRIRYATVLAYFENDRQEEALRRMGSFMEHCRSVLPEGNAQLIKMQSEHGDMLREMKRHEQALEIFEVAHSEAMKHLAAGAAARWSVLSDLQEARLELHNYDGALAINDQILADALLDEDRARMGWGIGGRLKILEPLDRSEEVDRMLDELIEQWWDEPLSLNDLAWGMADDDDTDRSRLRYPDRLLRMAQRACQLTDNVEPAYLDTLSRVHYERGDLDNAIEIQEQAIALVPEEDRKEYLESLDFMLAQREARTGVKTGETAP